MTSGNNPSFTNGRTATQIGEPKNMVVGLLLAIFFGGLGLLYATARGAITMIIVQIVTFVLGVIISALTFGLGTILLVPVLIIENFICVYWAYKAINEHNLSI